MIEPEYYPLRQAAEILNCSEDMLIHFGAIGKLPIYILTMKYFVECYQMERGREIAKPEPWGTINRLAKLWRGCLLEFEADKQKETTVMIEPEPYYDENGHMIGEYRYQLKHKTMLYPSSDMLRDAQRKGIIYPPPMLVKDCVLVIMSDDLKRLQDSEPQAESVINTSQKDVPEEQIDYIRTNRYKERDIDAVAWVNEVDPDLESMTVPQIQAALQARNKILWAKGFNEWNRDQKIWHKKRGRKAASKTVK